MGVFIDKVLAAAKEYLAGHKDELWNAPLQGLVLRRAQNLVPALANWDEEKHGRAYMEDLFHALQEFPDERETHAKVFPQDLWETAEQLSRPSVHIQGTEYGGVDANHHVGPRRRAVGSSPSSMELKTAGSRLL